MSQEIVKVERIQTGEIMSIAKAFFESGMFIDIKSAAQAVVKIQAGQEIGIPPFAAMSGIHIIQGKPTIGAGLIASRIKGSGKYDYEVKEQSEKACSIDFYQGKKMIGNSTFTIEDAKKAGTKNLDKFPRNMLFARAISNGVKWFCPDVFAGPIYTPEDFDVPAAKAEDISHEELSDKQLSTLYSLQSESADFLDAWDREVSSIDTKSKLMHLYNSHKDTVDNDDRLRKLFKERQTQLEATTKKTTQTTI